MSNLYGQVQFGGEPRSLHFTTKMSQQIAVIQIPAPDRLLIDQQDNEDVRNEKSYRVGVEIPLEINLLKEGTWTDIPGQGRICQLSLECKGGVALGVNFSRVQLPEGSDLFIYSNQYQQVIGALKPESFQNNEVLSVQPLKSDQITLEYFQPYSCTEEAIISVSGLAYLYRGDLPVKSESFNKSSDCEVNINCSEGEQWQDKKRGVVKILTKVGQKYFYCTGTLLNNTRQDYKPLLLTAAHCCKDFAGGYSSAEDYNNWVFYFNYEAESCENQSVIETTLVGAKKLATSEFTGDVGSDFLLLQLLDNIPASYKPYYCGWDASFGLSANEVCIHHPNGEIKKISTSSKVPGSGTWGTKPDTHWIITWDATTNGHGVTEGGSSGSPLFSHEGLIIGTLTGGESSCTNTTGEDMFGKVDYSWVSNGTLASEQLKPWLDPDATGQLKITGTYNSMLAVADFSASVKAIRVGGTIDFHDLSSGQPNSWHWYFQGADPAESTEQNPTGVRFNHFGLMNVKLVVSNQISTDSLVKEGYISVKSVISPNPSTGIISVLTDVSSTEPTLVKIYDCTGALCAEYEHLASNGNQFNLKLPQQGNLFFVNLIKGSDVQYYKVIVIH